MRTRSKRKVGPVYERPIGRDAELGVLDRFLATADHGATALVLEGPAGIGKSTLWVAAVDEARRRGRLVLAARPSGAEATWAYQSLADLLGGIDPAQLAVLPSPQRHAIEIALLRQEPEGPGLELADPQAIAAGTTSLLVALARRASIVLAVDDAPWLDHATATVLRSALRRIGGLPIGILLAQRVEVTGAAPLDVDRVVPTERRWVGPLSLGALHLLLWERLGLTLPRPTLARLQEASQGNPLHALEIGRALQRLDRPPRPGDPLPVPGSMRALIEERLAGASPTLRSTLLLAAAAGPIRAVDLVDATEGEGSREIAEAADAGLLVIEDGLVRFSHPAFATAAYEAAAGDDRRRAHERLARLARSAEVRARHLALSSVVPDGSVAAELETAAREAGRRGATEEAAELARLSMDRTPEADEAAVRRRGLLLANVLFSLPDLPAAQAMLDRILPALPAGAARAEARMLAGTIAWYTSTSRAAVDHLLAALPDALDDRELLGRIHYRLSVFYEFDLRSAAHHAGDAVDLLRGTGARVTCAAALYQRMATLIAIGDRPDLSLLDEGLELEVDAATNADQNTVPGIWWLAIDRPDRARARFGAMLEASRMAGESSGEADLLTRLAETELYADRWTAARAYADEASMVAQQEGQSFPDPARRVRALIDAHEGGLDEARAVAMEGLARAEGADDLILVIAWSNVLAFAAASAGDPATVADVAARADHCLGRAGLVEPLRLDPAPEWIEALVELGRLDEAETRLASLESRARVVPRPWADAAIARGRARLSAALGRMDVAVAATDPATDERSASWRTFDRARTLLVRGEVLRAARSRRAAAEAIESALTTFEQLGATAWAARARAELDRLGRRRPGSDDLTPTERRVAELAAAGLRNREVAEALGMSAKTVEAHLARVYTKLGIRSRAELGRWRAARD